MSGGTRGLRFGSNGVVRCRALVALLLCAIVALPVAAAGNDAPAGKPRVQATILDGGAAHRLRLDGVLDEAEWATADSIARLTMVEPEEGGVPTGLTVVRVLATSDDLILGFRCYDPDPAGIVSFSKARDTELDEEDHVLVVLDTFGDSRSGYVFAVNPGGSRFDGIVTSSGEDVNSNWDTSWEAGTATDALGWSAEMRLPIRGLSFKKGLEQWGFNVERRLQRLQETSRWSGAKLDYEIFQTVQAGVLDGIPKFDLGIGLTVQPGLVAVPNRLEPGRARNLDSDISLDLNQRLGPNLTGSVTLNTDFGETEVDVRQTNLSRFDVFFPERRSFFLQGADIFDFGSGLLGDEPKLVPFFSRRVGLVVPEGEDESAAEEVPIRAGGKIQGRVGNTNLAGLVVSTDRLGRLGVPRTTVGAFRVQQNVLAESSVGVIGTFGDPIGRSRSWLGGADFTFRSSKFRADKNLVAGVWGLTTDREELDGDKNAYGARLAYPNDDLDLGLNYMRIGDGFLPSMGFVQRTGHLVEFNSEYNQRPEKGAFRRRAYGVSGFLGLTPDGGWDSYAANVKPVDWQLETGDRIEATIEPQGERPEEDFDVFESPDYIVEMMAGEYRWTRYAVLASIAAQRHISGEFGYSFGGFYDGDLQTVEARVLLKPAKVLNLELSGERNVGTLPAGDFTQFLYGARAELRFSANLQVTSFLQYDNESRSLGSASRMRWTFHPLGDLFMAYNQNTVRSFEEGRRRWHFESDQFLIKVQYAVRL